MTWFKKIGHTFSQLGKSIQNTAHSSAQSAIRAGHHWVPKIERAIDKGLDTAADIADKATFYTGKVRKGAEKAAEFALPIAAATGFGPEAAAALAAVEAADLGAQGAKKTIGKTIEKKKSIKKDVDSILGGAERILKRF